ncbi:MAG: hypothetical protein ACE5GV_00270 [Candidatus Scalindua sp.]
MNIDEYVAHTGITKQKLGALIGCSMNGLYKYNGRSRRPQYDIAKRLVEFTSGKISYEDLGWNKDGTKIIPWTQKELRNNLNPHGSQVHDPVSTNSLDTSKKEGTVLLQSEEYRERERHKLY